MSHAAILTGDLIASTDAGPAAIDRTLERIHVVLERGQTLLGIGPTSFTRFRGDGWQAQISPANRYLRVVTAILAAQKMADGHLETRIGIGLGSIIRPGTRDLADAAGEALVFSGQALDAIGPSDRLSLRATDQAGLAWPTAALETLTYLSSRWSAEQAEAVYHRIMGDAVSLTKISATLNISRQALSSRLAVAGEKPLMALIRAAEASP